MVEEGEAAAIVVGPRSGSNNGSGLNQLLTSKRCQDSYTWRSMVEGFTRGPAQIVVLLHRIPPQLPIFLSRLHRQNAVAVVNK